MAWRVIVAALDAHEGIRSRVSVYRHPLAGRPILWHVLRAVRSTSPAPDGVLVLGTADALAGLDADEDGLVEYRSVLPNEASGALRAAAASSLAALIVDAAAPLVTPGTLARLGAAGARGRTAALAAADGSGVSVAVAGPGLALGEAPDPRAPADAAEAAADGDAETLRVVDRHTLRLAGLTIRDRLVREHEAAGVSFVVPDTNWIDVDVRIGRDTIVYPGCVLEGATAIGEECVIGPHSRVIDSTVGRGAELGGWNYLCRAHVRNRAVLEPFARRGGE